MMFKNITLSGILVYLLEREEAEFYAKLVTNMLKNGTLEVPVAAVMPLAEAVAAHEAVEAGQRGGTVILTT
jgi:NADPH2:quinone reductase